MSRYLGIFLPLVILSACTQQAADPAAQGPFIRGTARVVSVDQKSGCATLEYEGRQVRAYWQMETASPQGGSVVRTDRVGTVVGQYREPEVRAQVFEAKPGDTIGFMGMRTGDSIFLQGIAVVAR